MMRGRRMRIGPKSELAAIVEKRQITRNFLVLCHLFWFDGMCIELESTRDAS
jgi:hypothetical protein